MFAWSRAICCAVTVLVFDPPWPEPGDELEELDEDDEDDEDALVVPAGLLPDDPPLKPLPDAPEDEEVVEELPELATAEFRAASSFSTFLMSAATADCAAEACWRAAVQLSVPDGGVVSDGAAEADDDPPAPVPVPVPPEGAVVAEVADGELEPPAPDCSQAVVAAVRLAVT